MAAAKPEIIISSGILVINKYIFPSTQATVEISSVNRMLVVQYSSGNMVQPNQKWKIQDGGLHTRTT
jgi:hypothetical protein